MSAPPPASRIAPAGVVVPGPVEAAMDAIDHRRQIEQQITWAWQTYVTACLDQQADSAALAMEQIDRLLDRMPRQRTGVHDLFGIDVNAL